MNNINERKELLLQIKQQILDYLDSDNCLLYDKQAYNFHIDSSNNTLIAYNIVYVEDWCYSQIDYYGLIKYPLSLIKEKTGINLLEYKDDFQYVNCIFDEYTHYTIPYSPIIDNISNKLELFFYCEAFLEVCKLAKFPIDNYKITLPNINNIENLDNIKDDLELE